MKVRLQTMLLLPALLTASFQLRAHEVSVVTPPEWQDVEGDAATVGFPDGFRFQQLIPAEWLSSVPLSHNEITQIAFRPSAEVAAPFDLPFGNVTLRLSTTTKQPGELSLVYAENSGADETIVFQGPASLTTQNILDSNGITKAFDIGFPFTSPFDFDRSGNLLVDVMVEPTANVPVIPDAFTDFVFAETGSLTQIHEVGHNAGPDTGFPTAAMANLEFIGGNILEVTFVPEPGTFWLAAIAFLSTLVITKLRK